MSQAAPELRLRLFTSLVIFVSAYAPLILILIIKDYDPDHFSLLPRHPLICLGASIVALGSIVVVRRTMHDITDGLNVEIIKASNKSGDMFGYTIPYMLSFFKLDLGDWQSLVSVLIFMTMMFVMAYKTQNVIINPVLALSGYMLIDCTFKSGDDERQALVLTRHPLKARQWVTIERLSHYLYAAAHTKA